MTRNARFPALPFSATCLGIATFAAMDAFMKGVAIAIGAYNAVLWRTGIALLLAIALFLWKRRRWPARAAIRIHVLRGALTAVMAFLFFWGLTHVPLAEGIGLSFIAPLIALYLAAVLLKEQIARQAILASLIGFVGVAIIVGGRLSGEYSDELGQGIAAILLSAVLYAYNLILQRQQALLAGPIEIVLFQNGTMFALYLPLAPLFAVVPAAEQLPQLAAAALLATASILLLSWAYARAEASILIPVEYTAFVWAVLFGALFFNELVSAATLAGTALIVVGCLIATRQQPRQVEHIETTAV